MKDASEYKRNCLRPKDVAREQLIVLSSAYGGISKAEGAKIVDDIIEGDYFNQNTEPTLSMYIRKNMLDKEEVEMTLTDYLEMVESKGLVLAPTFTTYLPVEREVSWIGEYVHGNMVKRGVIKKNSFKAKAEGKLSLALRLHFGQVNVKLKNNAISGIFNSKGSILYNPSSHSTLTSITRLITSTANTNSERLVGGNRHYHNVDILLADIASVVNSIGDYQTVGSEYRKWMDIVVKYKLHLPTVDDVVDIVSKSSCLYWRDTESMEKVQRVVEGLDPIMRAAFCYTGDLYNLRKYNSSMAVKLFDALNKKIVVNDIMDDVVDLISVLPDTVLLHVHHIFMDEIRGIGTNYRKYDQQLLTNMYLTAINVIKSQKQYGDLISICLYSQNLPPAVFDMKDMIRDSVMMSDTDSGSKTLGEWVQWRYGNMYVSCESISLASSVVLLCGDTLKSNLRQIMKNMGINDEEINIDRLKMKSEFTFITFGLMSISKHYWAGINIQEGNVKPETELEIKGGSLKSSSIPEDIRKKIHQIPKDIYTKIEANEKVNLGEMLGKILDIEMEIMRDVYRGSTKYLRLMSIDIASAYKIKDQTKNAYQHCVWWNKVFSEKYNYTATAPYKAVKVHVELGSKTEMVAWINTMPENMRTNMKEWVRDFNKDKMAILYLPLEYVVSNGIPEEIQRVVNIKKIVLDICNMGYIILEGLSYYKKEGLTLTESMGYSIDPKDVLCTEYTPLSTIIVNQ